ASSGRWAWSSAAPIFCAAPSLSSLKHTGRELLFGAWTHKQLLDASGSSEPGNEEEEYPCEVPASHQPQAHRSAGADASVEPVAGDRRGVPVVQRGAAARGVPAVRG